MPDLPWQEIVLYLEQLFAKVNLTLIFKSSIKWPFCQAKMARF